MSFFKKALQVVSAPVTLPAKAFSNVVDNVAPKVGLSSQLAPISNTFSAPWAYTSGQKNLGGAVAQAQPGISLGAGIVSSLPSGVTGGFDLGFDEKQLSSFTDLFGSFGKMNPVPGVSTKQNSTLAAPTPFRTASGTPSYLIPAIVVGGGIISYFLFFKR